jgi:small basic protein (TIGR04137 family)
VTFVGLILPNFTIGRRGAVCYKPRPRAGKGAGPKPNNDFMSQHRSLRAASALAGKRNVLKRFERLEILRKAGEWKEGARITGLRKTKPPV